MPWHATAKASLQNHFDGAGEAGDAGAAQTSQQAGACTDCGAFEPDLNAAAVSNTAIAPSSSLLPPLSSRRSAVLPQSPVQPQPPPSRCHRRSVTSAAAARMRRCSGIRTHVRSENCLCVRAFISRELNSVLPVADCQSRAFGHSKPAGAINITPASENPDILRQK